MPENISNDFYFLPVGAVVDGYTVRSIIGNGGFGATYIVYDGGLDNDYVLKENMPRFCCTRNSTTREVSAQFGKEMEDGYAWALDRFKEEARTLAKLQHPNIVRVLRSFEAFGTAYYVMEKIDGADLLHVTEQRRDEAFLLHLLRRLLNALQYLHGKDILHRDIKPSNILVTKQGEPVLIDFGTARSLISEHTHTQLKSQGYTPFEQIQTKGKVGPWTDLYALGATFCHVLTGQCPPDSTDRILEDEFEPLSERADLKAAYSRSFLSSIDKALQPLAKNRWQNVEEWLAALSSCTATESVPQPLPRAEAAPDEATARQTQADLERRIAELKAEKEAAAAKAAEQERRMQEEYEQRMAALQAAEAAAAERERRLAEREAAEKTAEDEAARSAQEEYECQMAAYNAAAEAAETEREQPWQKDSQEVLEECPKLKSGDTGGQASTFKFNKINDIGSGNRGEDFFCGDICGVSNDGKTAIFKGFDELLIYNLAEKKRVKIISFKLRLLGFVYGKNHYLGACAISPDGEYIAVVADDKLRLISCAYGTKLCTVAEVPKYHSSTVHFTPDSKNIVWSSFKDIFTYEIKSRKTSKILSSRVRGYIRNLVMAPDGKHAAFTNGAEDVVVIADTEKQVVLCEVDSAAKFLQYSPTGDSLFSASSTVIRRYHAITGKEEKRYKVEGTIKFMSLAPRGNYLAVGIEIDKGKEKSERCVIILDTASGVEVGRIPRESHYDLSACFIPGSSPLQLVVGYEDLRLNLS